MPITQTTLLILTYSPKSRTWANRNIFLNFLIFAIVYIYVILYQYQLHTPAAYYISMFFDIIFCIYLVNFTNSYIYSYNVLYKPNTTIPITVIIKPKRIYNLFLKNGIGFSPFLKNIALTTNK